MFPTSRHSTSGKSKMQKNREQSCWEIFREIKTNIVSNNNTLEEKKLYYNII